MMSSTRQLIPFIVYLDHHSMERQCIILKVVTSQSQDLQSSYMSYSFPPPSSSHSLLTRLHHIRALGIFLSLDYSHDLRGGTSFAQEGRVQKYG
jgi:hypothetical protein